MNTDEWIHRLYRIADASGVAEGVFNGPPPRYKTPSAQVTQRAADVFEALVVTRGGIELCAQGASVPEACSMLIAKMVDAYRCIADEAIEVCSIGGGGTLQ